LANCLYQLNDEKFVKLVTVQIFLPMTKLIFIPFFPLAFV